MLLPPALLAVLQAMVLALASLGAGPAAAADLQADASRAAWASPTATLHSEDKKDQSGRIDPDRGSGGAALPGSPFALAAVPAAHAGPGLHRPEFVQPSRRTRTHPPTGPPLT